MNLFTVFECMGDKYTRDALGYYAYRTVLYHNIP